MEEKGGERELLRRFPHAPIDHDNKHYYSGLLEREIRIDKCERCGRWFTPPRWLCPSCWSTDVVARPVKGSGRVEMLSWVARGHDAAWPGLAVRFRRCRYR